MQVSKVNYTRLKAMKNYENERCGVELELQVGDTISGAFAEARRLVNLQLGLVPSKGEIEKAKQVLREAGEL